MNIVGKPATMTISVVISALIGKNAAAAVTMRRKIK